MKKQYKILTEKYSEIIEAKKKMSLENIPEVLRNIPEIVNDINGFEKWFFTHTHYAAVAGDLGSGALMDVYHARTEDYNEGEGLEWSEAEYKVEKDFKKWAKQYLQHKKASKALQKGSEEAGFDLDV